MLQVRFLLLVIIDTPVVGQLRDLSCTQIRTASRCRPLRVECQASISVLPVEVKQVRNLIIGNPPTHKKLLL
jgi:hypothetical protein